MGNLYNNNYFRSSDIKVFPSSFRGEYDWGVEIAPATLVFDPEARLNTEANFILPKNALGKTTYIRNYNQTEDKIAFFLDGYYFEILNVSNYLAELANRFVGIKLREITLQEETAENTTIKYDSERKTKILDSWEPGSSDLLDYAFEEKQYYFTGLKVLDEGETGANYMLKLFIATTDSPPVISVNQEELLPDIDHGSGENTFLHGTGLVAGYTNQTVVGRYNTNYADTLFEIGGGTGPDSNLRKTMLAVTPTETRITVDTKINGNTSIEGTAVDITGKLTIDGDTSITGDTSIIGNTTIAGDTIDLTGQTTILGNTSVEGNTSITGSTEIIANGEGKTINLTGPTTIVGTTAITGATTINGDTTVKGTTINIEGTTINIKGTTNTITGPLAVTQKVTSASTLAADSGSTLTTKDYVDNRINTLDYTNIGANGKYIKKISQTNGLISTETQDFDTIITKDSKHNYAPTSLAVWNLTDSTIKSLKFDGAGGDSGTQYVKYVNQADGKISASAQAFSSDLLYWTYGYYGDKNYGKYLKDDWSTNKSAPTEQAVWAFGKAISAKTVDEFQNSDVLKQVIINTIYPVGSIYTYIGNAALPEENNPTNSNIKQPKCPISHGKWELIDGGRFLCSASYNKTGDTTYNYVSNGAKQGGSANAVLIAHSHAYAKTTTDDQSTSHTHELSIPCSKAGTGKYTGFEGNAGDLTSGMSLVTMVTQAPGINRKFGWMCGGSKDYHDTSIGGDVSELLNSLYDNPGSADKAVKSDNHNHGLPTINTTGRNNENKDDTSITGTNANLPPYIVVYMWKRIS